MANRISISDEALKAELFTHFESGESGKTYLWDLLSTKYKLGKTRYYNLYNISHTEWAALKQKAQSEQLAQNETESLRAAGISKDRIVQEYAKIAFFDIRTILTVDGGLKPTNDWDDDAAAVINSLESFDEKEPESGMVLGTVRKVKLSSKQAALDSLCRVLGYNAPTKTAQTTKSGDDVVPPPLVDYSKLSIDELLILKKLSHKSGAISRY